EDNEKLAIGPEIAPVMPLGPSGLEQQHVGPRSLHVEPLLIIRHRGQLMLHMESCPCKSANRSSTSVASSKYRQFFRQRICTSAPASRSITSEDLPFARRQAPRQRRLSEATAAEAHRYRG